MRSIIILTVAAIGLGTAACQVTEDKNNHQTSVEFNDQLATNAVADVGNAATNIAGTIAADAKREAGKIDIKINDHKANEAAEDAASKTSTTTVTTKNADGSTTTTTTKH